MAIKQTQFVSMSDLYDRMAVHPDDFLLFKAAFENLLGPLVDPGYYVDRLASCKYPEYGLLLNEEQVKTMARELFGRILRTGITKAGGLASVTRVKIKYVQDALKDRMFDENGDITQDGWITIKDESDVEFTPAFFYEKVSDDEAKGILDEVAISEGKLKKSREEKKEEKKAAKEAKKAAKAKKTPEPVAV